MVIVDGFKIDHEDKIISINPEDYERAQLYLSKFNKKARKGWIIRIAGYDISPSFKAKAIKNG